MKKLNKKGFTLVELLAVVVILAILMTVAFSVVPSLQNNAQKTGMDTELRKVVNIIYRDIEARKLGQSSEYSYDVALRANLTESYGGVRFIVIEDNNYEIVLYFKDNSEEVLNEVCIRDTKTNKGSFAQITDNSIKYDKEYIDYESCIPDKSFYE